MMRLSPPHMIDMIFSSPWIKFYGLFFILLCSYSPSIVRAAYVHQSRQDSIVQYAQLTGACIMQSVQFLTFQAIPIFLQIRLDDSNYHIFPPCFTQMKWKIEGSSAHKHERTLLFFTFFPAIYSIYNGSVWKNRAGFSHVCVRVLSKIKISHSNIIPIYYCGAAQDRRGGSNWLWVYLAYGGHKLGSNWHRWRDIAMMQSALITCLLYII